MSNTVNFLSVKTFPVRCLLKFTLVSNYSFQVSYSTSYIYHLYILKTENFFKTQRKQLKKKSLNSLKNLKSHLRCGYITTLFPNFSLWRLFLRWNHHPGVIYLVMSIRCTTKKKKKGGCVR